ncbi:MAG: hypothetical protein GY946_04910, partial [bacterium]|nr:hypothetical protein [bacterium]
MGGQHLLIAKAVTAKTMTAPVGRRFGKSTSFPFLISEEHSDWIGLYRAIYFAQDHTKAKEMLELLLDEFGGDPAINKTSMVKSFHRS